MSNSVALIRWFGGRWVVLALAVSLTLFAGRPISWAEVECYWDCSECVDRTHSFECPEYEQEYESVLVSLDNYEASPTVELSSVTK